MTAGRVLLRILWPGVRMTLQVRNSVFNSRQFQMLAIIELALIADARSVRFLIDIDIVIFAESALHQYSSFEVVPVIIQHKMPDNSHYHL